MKTVHTPKYYVNSKHVGIIYDDDPEHDIIARVMPKNEQGDPTNSDLLRELIRKGNSYDAMMRALRAVQYLYDDAKQDGRPATIPRGSSLIFDIRAALAAARKEGAG